MKMSEEKKRVVWIGEQPDFQLFAMLRGEDYEIATLESPCRARDMFPFYKPHLIVVSLRYPKDVTQLEECLAIAAKVPVVAVISLIARPPLVRAVKEKAAGFIVLPVKPQVLRETLQRLGLSQNESICPSVSS
jgi:DNA-binding NtrC family response regulator